VNGNTCSKNQFGINLGESSNNILSNNSCSSNNQEGISLYISQNNTLTSNSCISNNHSGIFLSYLSNSNDISWNLVRNNTGYGVVLDLPACSSNRISYNIIIGNNGATGTYSALHAQARDQGTNNWWNGTDFLDNRGNYWSDWTTPVGPYIIPGSADAKDYHPLQNDPRYILPSFMP
jgi:parallel beta-helix repeat protein